MNSSKFGMNALLLVILIFSAIIFLITVKLAGVSARFAVNEYYPVEGTDLGIRYSSAAENGLCQGVNGNTAVLRLAGDFGHDWGAAREGKNLYLNEYSTTELGLMLCQVVKVDLETFEKQVILPDGILRGRGKNGELVCLSDCLLPADYPRTNALARLYALADGDLDPAGDGAMVLLLDPATGLVLREEYDGEAMGAGFASRWLASAGEEAGA